MAERVYLTVAEVVAIHHHQIEEYGGEHGMLNQGSLEAAVFRPQTGYYNGLSEEAAALLESLVNNHAFIDGNKRVGFAAAHTFLMVNGFDLDISSGAAFQFMMKAIADGKFRFALLREWIAAHLVPFSV
ncbi:MAG TPA: type II toxin-antitoxin system death-on-curing family toxin [Candidatus Deferrimicrobiaceae bacterium]|nr:type II toxin-antitoxin system death-on-curing family toxin [Candidatus Deferrimicrobiaceae bacterium]